MLLDLRLTDLIEENSSNELSDYQFLTKGSSLCSYAIRDHNHTYKVYLNHSFV
jgi:hypothetical protein